MALTYAEKLTFSNTIRTKFKEIQKIKSSLIDAADKNDPEKYEYLANVIFSKISVVETSLLNLKKLYLERLES